MITKSILSPLRCEKVLITLSGGTTGVSRSINDSSFFVPTIFAIRSMEGFMMTACGDKEKKKVDCGYAVMA